MPDLVTSRSSGGWAPGGCTTAMAPTAKTKIRCRTVGEHRPPPKTGQTSATGTRRRIQKICRTVGEHRPPPKTGQTPATGTRQQSKGTMHDRCMTQHPRDLETSRRRMARPKGRKIQNEKALQGSRPSAPGSQSSGSMGKSDTFPELWRLVPKACPCNLRSGKPWARHNLS